MDQEQQDKEAERAAEKRAERERHEREAEEGAAALTRREQREVQENASLSPVTVYAIVRREGEEELRRPPSSLWWSGVAAGVGIAVSVLAEGTLHHHLDGHPYRAALENFGYCIGFLIVILSRLQLFTENTITVILPVLAQPTRGKIWCSARLWAIVFAANMVGTFLTAFITIYVGTVPPEITEAMLALSRKFADKTVMEAFLYGIPAGFLIAALVWMLPSSRGSEFWVIIAVTYVIAMAGTAHVVAGSVEVFLLLLNGELGPGGALGLILPALLGNIVGGSGLFAVLAYAQVQEEM